MAEPICVYLRCENESLPTYLDDPTRQWPLCAVHRLHVQFAVTTESHHSKVEEVFLDGRHWLQVVELSAEDYLRRRRS